MFTKRIIPCLDVHNGRVVKGINFVNLRDAGDPVEVGKAYGKAGADELVFYDITASAEGRALTCMPLSNMDEFQQAYPKIQEIGVRECLNDSKYMELINTRSTTVLAHNEKCRECPYRNVCLGGCRAAGMLTQPGDILAPDEATCAIYRDGWLRKIVSKVKELRPEAECVERKQLSELGLMDNLPGVF